jgi:cyclic pyranopterin phosphate synthase
MSDLTHIGRDGQARMVDVGAKPDTDRMARAAGTIRMRPETLSAIRDNVLAKGDVLGVARVAGIMAAKRTADLVPLCHPVALTDVQIEAELDDALPGVRVEAVARTTGKTGVEMEAIVAVSVTLITVYDMAKGVDKDMLISGIALLEKRGGRSGHWVRERGP